MIKFDKPKTLDATKKNSFRLPSVNLADLKKVQLGGQGPVFRIPAVMDNGKVKLGGQGPIFRK